MQVCVKGDSEALSVVQTALEGPGLRMHYTFFSVSFTNLKSINCANPDDVRQ